LKRVTAGLIASIAALATACSDSDSNSPLTPEAPLLQSYTLSSNDSVPEGVAYDSRDRAFYATSLQGASIVRLDAAGQESIFRAADNRASLVGTKVDSTRRRLWVCAQEVDGVDNRVWVFDLESAQLDMEFELGALSTGGSCNDLALSSDGAAYVTDPANPYLYRLDPETGTGEILATDPQFNNIVSGADLGLNGIALTPDETALIVGKFAPASLFRVSLPDADSIELMTLSGDTLPPPDGLMFFEDDLYTVSNNSVSRVRMNESFSAGEVVTVAQKSGLSTATVAESNLYVIKSEVFNFVIGAPLNLPFEIFQVDTATFDQ